MIAAMTGRALDSAVTQFDEVYRDHADDVYRFCVSQLRDPDVAEDVTADVFASAFAAYQNAAPDRAGARPWLFRIARNAVIDEHRRAGRRRSLLGRLGRTRPQTASVEETAQQRTDLLAICAALDTLGTRDQQLVGLRVAAGLSFADLGAVLGMREGAARTATQRALQRLRARLAEARP